MKDWKIWNCVTVIEESFFPWPEGGSGHLQELLWFSPNSWVFMGSKWGMKIAGLYCSFVSWATQGNSRHRESKKSWFFVYSSPFFIVLFFWHALASLFLLSFPEFRKMLKMSSFFRLAKDSKKVSPQTTFKSVLSFWWLWNDNEWWETKWWVNCSQVRQIKTGYEENEAQKKNMKCLDVTFVTLSKWENNLHRHDIFFPYLFPHGHGV